MTSFHRNGNPSDASVDPGQGANIPLDNSRSNEYIGSVAGKIQAELKQTKPFESLAVEAGVNLARTHDAVLRGVEQVLRPTAISPTQFNVLRILRGAGTQGRACGEIAERMVTRDPDITRLLDRLEARKLVSRAREEKDRRVVKTRITAAGLRLLKHLDRPIAEAHEQMLGHLGERRLRQLIQLLEDARTKSN